MNIGTRAPCTRAGLPKTFLAPKLGSTQLASSNGSWGVATRYPHPCTRIQASESSSQSSTSPPSLVPEAPERFDRFTVAALRLKNLLAGAGDGEGELMNKAVSDMDVSYRLQMQVVAAGAITLTAVVIAQLTGNDPWGGASLSQDTLHAFLLGSLAAIPLVMVRLWSWSPEAAARMPVVEELHQSQLEIINPWFSNVSRPQLALMMALDVLPLLLLVLPAAQGAIVAFVGLVDTALGTPPAVPPPMDNWGVDPEDIGAAASALPTLLPAAASEETTFLRLGALSLTAFVMSSSRASELDADVDEEEVVATAVENADRFYRVTAKNQQEAQSAASAFKAVAQAFLETKQEVAFVGSAFIVLDVFVMGGLWYATNNLAAPAAAALATNWVEYYKLHELVLTRERKGVGRSL